MDTNTTTGEDAVTATATAPRATQEQRRAGIDLFRRWRMAGVPMMVTADEAHRLAAAEGVRVPRWHAGDHSTPVSLAHAALVVVTR